MHTVEGRARRVIACSAYSGRRRPHTSSLRTFHQLQRLNHGKCSPLRRACRVEADIAKEGTIHIYGRYT